MRLADVKEKAGAAMCALAILLFCFCLGSLLANPVSIALIVAAVVIGAIL